MFVLARRAASIAVAATFVVACKAPDSAAKVTIDADPWALLPGSALVVGRIDGRAIVAAGPSSLSLDDVTAPLLPLGDDAGVRPSRDVDTIVLAGYGGASEGAVAVLVGRFDPDAIARATRTRTGAPIVVGQYEGFTTCTAGAWVIAPLTPRTLVSGTRDGVRRTLERLHDGHLERAMPPWVVTTAEAPGATWALAADFSAQPIVAATVGSVSVPWVKGMRTARLVGTLAPPAMNVAGTLSYGSPDDAQNAAQGIHLVDRWLSVLAPFIGGVTLQNLKVTVDGSDVNGTFSVDDRALRTLVSLAPRVLPALAR